MSQAKTELLGRIVDEVARNGLADRSLRDLAESIGSSHRMVLYHFDSRAGLVASIVELIERTQRDMLLNLSTTASTAGELAMALWHQVSAPDMLPFVRLFFECVAVTGASGLTDPWLEVSEVVTERMGITFDVDEIRLGVAVTRGLLIDVLATGDAAEATRSMARFAAQMDGGKPPGAWADIGA